MVLLFDFGTILVGLSKNRCIEALKQIGCGRIAYYVDECRQEDLFHELEIGGSVEAFCEEARRQSSYTDETSVFHPCTATDEEICWAWNQLLLDIPREKLRMIHHLHHNLGIHTAVLSNTNQIHWQYALQHLFTADGLTIDDYFDEIFLSCDLGMVKPDDCIYQEMARRLQHDCNMPSLQPSDILFIDDSAKNCIAAEANGIRTLHDPKGDTWMQYLQERLQKADDTPKDYAAVIGNFDGVHRGHVHVIENLKAIAAEHCLQPLVITFDRHPRALFDPNFQPEYLTTPDEKEALLRTTGTNVCIMPFTQALADTTAHDFMQRMHDEMGVKLLLLGYDNRFGKRNEYEYFDDYRQYGDECGIEVIKSSPIDVDGVRVSSSYVRHLISAGKVAEAASCLGRKFSISGRVTEGKQEGRKIGFPTANINAPYGKIVPANGVYATQTTVGDKTYDSVTNIGTRPTYHNGMQRTIETHIVGFNGDIYGKDISVAFRSRLRDEQEFDSPEALRQQIEHDIERLKD